MCIDCNDTGFVKRHVSISLRTMYGACIPEGTPLVDYIELVRCTCRLDLSFYQTYQMPLASGHR